MREKRRKAMILRRFLLCMLYITLEQVKSDVNSLIHMQEIRRLRKERGLKDIPVSNHLVFYGNPGTGKTIIFMPE